MKKILLICILFLSCTNPKQKSKIYSEIKNHKALDNKTQKEVKIFKDSTENKSKESFCVKIVKATLHKNQYSNHKDIQITFKNSGKKKIKAIKFEWFCLNRFNKPANGKYFYGGGVFKENYTNLIRPGETKTEYWENFSTDADNITKIRVYYIAYTDGTKWELTHGDIPL